MKKIDLGQTVGILANIGVIAGLIFVAIEIRTNTVSNDIAVETNYAGNWMTVNSAIAENADLATLMAKGLAGHDLDEAESLQFRHLTNMFLTQASHRLRLYDEGLISEAEVCDAFRITREYAQHGQFRAVIEAIDDERLKGLVLDDNGLERWLTAPAQ